MKKIYISSPKIEGCAKELLEKQGYSVTVRENTETPTADELIEAIKDKNALLCPLTNQVTKEVIEALPEKFKIIANYAVGFNNIDTKTAREKGIAVTNTPGTSEESVSEHALALMLAMVRRITEADAFMKAGKYKGWDPQLLLGENLNGKTLGLIGAGRIGHQMAVRAHHAFGMKIAYYDLIENKALEKEANAERIETKEELLKKARVVSLHVPLLPTTHHLISTEEFKMIGKDSYLINTSRGPVIDEEALAHALKNGIIRAAAIDVYENEPEMHAGLKELKNCITTPHIGSATIETRNKMATKAAESIIAVLEGEEVDNDITKPQNRG